MKNYEQIKTIEKNSSLIIQLSRPKKLNTFTETMMREIIDALDWAEQNNQIRSVIFTGDGEKFCAGADLSSGEDSFDWTEKKKSEKKVVREAGGVLTLRLSNQKSPLLQQLMEML